MSGQGARRFLALDAMRGVCAILVVLMHSSFLTGYDPFPSAYLVVDIFFMMSGFVIAHAYEAKLKRGGYFGTYTWRRYARLLPMWAVGLTLGVVAKVAFDRHGPDALVPLVFLLPGLLFLPQPGGEFLFPRNAPGWSLFFEMVANLIYGLVAPRLSTRWIVTLTALGAVLIALSAARVGGLDGGGRWRDFGVGGARILFGFSAGLLLHRVFQARNWTAWPAWSFIAAMIVLTGLARLAPGPAVRPLFDAAMVLILCPALVWLAIRAAAGSAWFAETLGAISYPLYAIHFAVMTATFSVWGHLHRWDGSRIGVGGAMLLVAATIGAAWVLGRYVDPAAQRLAGRIARRRPVEVPSPDAVVDAR